MAVGGTFGALRLGQRMSRAGGQDHAATEPHRIMGLPANEWEVFLCCGAVLGVVIGCWTTIPEPLFGLYALCVAVPAFLVAPIMLAARRSFEWRDHLAVGFAIILLAQALGGANGSLHAAKAVRNFERKQAFAQPLRMPVPNASNSWRRSAAIRQRPAPTLWMCLASIGTKSSGEMANRQVLVVLS